MLKFKLHHILSVCVGVVVVGGLVYINTSSYFSTSPVDGEAPTAPVAISENPLLKATKKDVGDWFPGTCFAEIYMQSSSYGGALVQGCIQKTAREIKAQTGAAVSAEDFRSPEVISHFKGVYGASNPWRS